MHIILGGTGQVGAATARALLKRTAPVTVVTRKASNASDLERAGARIAVVDIRDSAALRDVLRTGRRAFLLNPPAPFSSDTDAEERANVAAIVAALEGSGLEKVVAASTYGARPGARCGDLTVLYAFEQMLKAQSIPAAINRGAYYMSNWDLDGARRSGKLLSFIPADMAIPMVAPEDLGEAAARRLLEPVSDIALRHVEGPQRYAPRDVADALADSLGRNITVETVPPEAWEATFMRFGFSQAAARSYSCMTKTLVEGDIGNPDHPERGRTTLADYVRRAANAAG